MLTQGLQHRRVPKSPYKNHLFRRAILKKAAKDVRFQKALIECCRQDIIFFINVFVWQLNPDKVGSEVGPFITWACQDGWILQTIGTLLNPNLPRSQKNVIWEKSREMGATWMALIIALWLCLFHPNKRVIMISHTEEAVTKAGDEGTLFAKIQFMIEFLPEWMTKDYRKWKKGFKFPNRSTISGLASTKRSGVGDRVAFVLLDEFSKQRDASDIWGQTADVGPRLVIGTHYDNSGTYLDITKQKNLKKIIMHWSFHPDKKRGLYKVDAETREVFHLDPNYTYPAEYSFVTTGKPGGPFPGIRSPWYDAECESRNSSRNVALHLDIDPQGATSQFFDALQIDEIKRRYWRPPLWTGDLVYDDAGKPKELQRRRDGALRLWVHPTADGKLPVGTYGMGADISGGLGATPTCFEAFRVMGAEKQQMLEFADSNIRADDAATMFVALAWLMVDRYGNGAKCCWEIQGPGAHFGKKVLELGYRNIYYRKDEGNPIASKHSESPGWNPTSTNRRLTLELFRAAVQGKHCVIRSENIYDECLSFVYGVGGKVEHGRERNETDPLKARENHGDHVVAAALAWKMVEGLGELTIPEREQIVPTVNSIGGRRELRRRMASEEYISAEW